MVGVDLRQSLCISALETIAQLPAREEKVPLVHEATLVGRNRSSQTPYMALAVPHGALQ